MNLIFITFDSIQNSVFSGQVIQPLLKKINNNKTLKVYIVSFEKDNLSKEIISKYIPKNTNLIFKHYKRLPILGKVSLLPCIFLLKKFLKQFNNYAIIARGPIAGLVAKKSINKNCLSFETQARGLLAAEYEFSYLSQNNLFKKIWHKWRAKILFEIEKEIYSSNIIIKSVSPALSEYLIKTYYADSKNIILETEDIPEPISLDQKYEWRSITRTALRIANNTKIYCYNGAIKSWQCPKLVIEYFQEQLKKNNDIFLLILSQDKKEFEVMLKQYKIPQEFYLVLTVKHQDIYKYLCASDYGLIFRKSHHIVNWVSRPVKAMEYKSAGLEIIHNNTVKWLKNEEG